MIEAEHEAQAVRLFSRNEELTDLLRLLRGAALPDAWVASGAVYGSIWNALTNRPPIHGIKDYDVIYFDGTDLSWEAEDRVIRAFSERTAGFSAPIEVRNQARVHLWFPDRFGMAYPALGSATEGLRLYASRAHAVAVRLTAENTVEIAAPFGLGDVLAMRLRPNRALDNRGTHMAKAAQARRRWPEVSVEP